MEISPLLHWVLGVGAQDQDITLYKWITGSEITISPTLNSIISIMKDHGQNQFITIKISCSHRLILSSPDLAARFWN